MFEHKMQIRVYYADTDALGIVYHANYLRFFELARTESLRALGIELPFLIRDYGIQFAVVHANVQYHKPARLDDMLLLVSRIKHISRASVLYEQNIYLADHEDALICSAEIKLVTVDDQMHPRAVPDVLKQEILNDR